jgi:hypothetical protein
MGKGPRKFEIRNPGETKKTKVSQGRQIRMLEIQMTKTKDQNQISK